MSPDVVTFSRRARSRARRSVQVFLSERDKNAGVRPDVRGADETLDKLTYGPTSMSRFGDGEFLLMLGKGPRYQKYDPILAKRLAEVLIHGGDDLLVCIPDIFGRNERLIPRARNYWDEHLRLYRHDYYRLLDLRKTYYDSLVSRVYKDRADKRSSARLFERWKQVWDNQDVLFIEGSESRLGIGNDLFNNARSVRRIIGPSEHAFSAYDRLLRSALQAADNALCILALGPTATVLAHDLTSAGHRALDLGHIDIEYEWYLRGESRVAVPGKYVNEAPGGNVVGEIVDEEYERQIVDIVDI